MSLPRLTLTGRKAPWVGAGRGTGKGIALAVAEADVAVKGRGDQLFKREAMLP
jgi:hypothetical protein